ncbi:hypothetical protein JCM3774_005180 [Rhodotorula dairenensis]
MVKTQPSIVLVTSPCLSTLSLRAWSRLAAGVVDEVKVQLGASGEEHVAKAIGTSCACTFLSFGIPANLDQPDLLMLNTGAIDDVLLLIGQQGILPKENPSASNLFVFLSQSARGPPDLHGLDRDDAVFALVKAATNTFSCPLYSYSRKRVNILCVIRALERGGRINQTRKVEHTVERGGRIDQTRKVEHAADSFKATQATVLWIKGYERPLVMVDFCAMTTRTMNIVDLPSINGMGQAALAHAFSEANGKKVHHNLLPRIGKLPPPLPETHLVNFSDKIKQKLDKCSNDINS